MQYEWLVNVIAFGVFIVLFEVGVINRVVIWYDVVHVWDALSFEGVVFQMCNWVLEYWWCQFLVRGGCTSSCEAFDCVVVVFVFALQWKDVAVGCVVCATWYSVCQSPPGRSS